MMNWNEPDLTIAATDTILKTDATITASKSTVMLVVRPNLVKIVSKSVTRS